MDQSPVAVVYLDGCDAGVVSRVPGLAEKLAELDIVVIGAGSDLSQINVLDWGNVGVSSLRMAVCEPCGIDYYDEWRHEEANLPPIETLPGVLDGPRRYPGKVPKRTVWGRVSFGAFKPTGETELGKL